MVAYSSRQRMREFGIRKALGATTAGIYAVILRSSLRMLILGVMPGLVVAFAIPLTMRLSSLVLT
jgi:ABC-type antimicrobial peptide transport system permease subunit